MHVRKEIEDRSTVRGPVDICALLEDVSSADGISSCVAIEDFLTPNPPLSEILRHDSGPQRYFSPTVQDTFFSLPGTGSPGTECGDDVSYWCNCCKRWFQQQHSCGERQCPHCSHIWVRNQARRMRGRLWDGRDYYEDKEGERYRLHHIIVSYRMGIPEDGESYRHLRRSAYKIGEEAGIVGGCIVFHPWRESRDNVYEVVGPHFHIFGLGRWIKPGDELEPYTDDIIVKRVEDFDARQIEPFEYVLTHCGIAEGCHAIVWFGNLAYNKMPRGPQERAAQAKAEPEPEICPHCGSNNTTYVDMREIYGFIQRHPAWEDIPPKEM